MTSENGAQDIDCYVGCVASGPILMKPNVVHVIFFNFSKQKFVKRGTVTLVIVCKGGSLLIFKEKWPNDTKIRTKKTLVVGASASEW